MNTNVHVDPPASANESPNITNHIYIRDVKRKGNTEVPTKPQQLSFNASAVSENNVFTREFELNEGVSEQEEQEHVTTTPVKEPQMIYARKVIITTERLQ